jgi:creatinine amidohydrolase
MAAAPKLLWGECTDAEIERARDEDWLVLVPLGAVEQHGRHLPVDTDIGIARRVTEDVAAHLDRTLVTPSISWGYSAAHMGFPSTISLRPETLTSLLEDVCDSLVHHGFKRIAIVSAHGTNRPVTSLFVREFMRRHGLPIVSLHYSDFGKAEFARVRDTPTGGELHGGEFETSLQLHLHPELVRSDQLHGERVDPARHFGISTAGRDILDGGVVTIGYDIKTSFPEGVMGEPDTATAEKGAQVYAAIVDGISTALDEFRSADLERLSG